MKKLIVFDVDGTLLDTIETITFHINKTLETIGVEKVDSRFTSKVLGYSSRFLMEEVLKSRGYKYENKELDRLLDVYHDFYRADVSYLTRPYDGVIELLEDLKASGYMLAALSNKPDHTLSVLFNEIDFNKYFDYVSGQRDEIAKKPKPDMVYEIRDRLGISLGEMCLVGDTEVDFKTSQNSGIDFIAVSWGFRTKEQLEALAKFRIVDTVEELKEKIKGE